MRAPALLLAAATLLAGCLGPAADPLPAVPVAPPAAPRCADPCKVLVDAGEGSAFEPMVAANPADPQHLVIAASERTLGRMDEERRWNVAYVSRDGGATWEASRIPGGPGAGPGHPLATATDMGDGVAAFLPDGTVLYAGLALNMLPLAWTAYTLYVARSTDGGLTWPEVAVVAEGRGALAWTPVTGVPLGWFANDKPWLTVGPDGTALLTWSPIDARVPLRGSTDLAFAASTDGRAWSEPAYIEQGRQGGSTGSFPAIGPSGAWYVVFTTFQERPSIHLATSRDRGATWEVATVVEEARFGWPTLRAGPWGPGGAERLYLAYAGGEGDPEVPLLLASDDGGATWGAPLALDEPREPLAWIQVAMDVAPDGTVHAGFFHGAPDGAAEYRLASVRDGALLGHATLDAGLAGGTGLRGHYTGVAALPAGAYATWVTGGGDGFHDPARDLAGAPVALG